MSLFEPLNSDDNLKEIIKSAYDLELDISGSWGYTQDDATIIHSTDTPLHQFEHIFASMRAYTEMSMTKEKDDRYGSININEISREELTANTILYHKVVYEVTAMKESLYTTFIKEYKENYGKEAFDLALHFKRREAATLHREVTHWFQIN